MGTYHKGGWLFGVFSPSAVKGAELVSHDADLVCQAMCVYKVIMNSGRYVRVQRFFQLSYRRFQVVRYNLLCFPTEFFSPGCRVFAGFFSLSSLGGGAFSCFFSGSCTLSGLAVCLAFALFSFGAELAAFAEHLTEGLALGALAKAFFDGSTAAYEHWTAAVFFTVCAAFAAFAADGYPVSFLLTVLGILRHLGESARKGHALCECLRQSLYLV